MQQFLLILNDDVVSDFFSSKGFTWIAFRSSAVHILLLLLLLWGLSFIIIVSNTLCIWFLWVCWWTSVSDARTSLPDSDVSHIWTCSPSSPSSSPSSLLCFFWRIRQLSLDSWKCLQVCEWVKLPCWCQTTCFLSVSCIYLLLSLTLVLLQNAFTRPV